MKTGRDGIGRVQRRILDKLMAGPCSAAWMVAHIDPDARRALRALEARGLVTHTGDLWRRT